MFGLQVNSMQTSVKAGRAQSAILKALAKFFFSSHLNAVLNNSHVLRSASKILMTQAYLPVA